MTGKIRLIVPSLLVLMAYAAPVHAQRLPPGFHVLDDFEGFILQRQIPELQSVLGVNDQDWTVLVTKIKKVMRARSQLGTVRDFSVGPPPPLPPGTKVVNWKDLPFPLLPIEVAMHELMDALADPNTPADVINSRLETYRSIRQKLLADLRIAEDDLKSICTLRQEAVLVSYGLVSD